MNAIVLEHVPVAELPATWRAKMAHTGDVLVTVRIEEETPAQAPAETAVDNPLFGMWREREDMADVAAYVREQRASRFDKVGGGTLDER